MAGQPLPAARGCTANRTYRNWPDQGWERDIRIGCDLFLLGNLTSFLFSGINFTSGMFSQLDPQFHPNRWGGTYAQALPYLREAFEKTLHMLTPQLDELIRKDALAIIRELCDPELSKRGHPRGIGRGDQYSLERYKSRFDLLLKEKAIAIKAKKVK